VIADEDAGDDDDNDDGDDDVGCDYGYAEVY